MQQIISKQEVEEMINNGVDCDYEIFLKICDAIEPTKEALEVLSEIYQIIYATTVVEGELNNGGFYQYYGNSTAEQYNEIAIKSFTTIGAKETAVLLQEVWDKILEQSETFRAEYKTIGIQNAFNKANDEMDEIEIDEYDDKFYKIAEKEDFKELRLAYIKKKIDSFE